MIEKMHANTTQDSLPISFTPREQQCFYWAAKDKSIKETAEEMFVSASTVRKYREKILQKINCKSMTGAVAYILNLSLIEKV